MCLYYRIPKIAIKQIYVVEKNKSIPFICRYNRDLQIDISTILINVNYCIKKTKLKLLGLLGLFNRVFILG